MWDPEPIATRAITRPLPSSRTPIYDQLVAERTHRDNREAWRHVGAWIAAAALVSLAFVLLALAAVKL